MFRECAYCTSIVKIPPRRLKASKSGLIFCNRRCKEKAQSLKGGVTSIQPEHYGRAKGKWRYRQWAFEEYGKVCSRCGYNEDERMLDVDHVNGNRNDNSITNLQVLCVWCHALKTRGITGV